MTRASKPSGAPTRSRRPGSSATRRICAAEAGRLPSAIAGAPGIDALVSFIPERPELAHQFTVVRRRRVGPLEDPAIDVVVVFLEQRLEQVELGLAEARNMAIRERPQNEVRFPEAAPPGAHLQLLSSGVVARHSGTRHIGRAHRAHQPHPDNARPFGYFLAAAFFASAAFG